MICNKCCSPSYPDIKAVFLKLQIISIDFLSMLAIASVHVTADENFNRENWTKMHIANHYTSPSLVWFKIYDEKFFNEVRNVLLAIWSSPRSMAIIAVCQPIMWNPIP